MFSKWRLSLATTILVLFSFVLGSCTLPTNEDPPNQKLPDNKGFGDSKCLSAAFPVLKKFVDGEALPEEITAVWDCFGSVLTTFEKSTRGSKDDRFSSQELANFVENYFLENTLISQRLLTEIFHLKQLFLGGELNSLTRKEIKQLVLLGGQLKNISLRLGPYMKVFSLNWVFNPAESIDAQVRFFEGANLEVQTAAKELGKIIATNGMGYQLDNFVILLEELSALYHESWSFIDDVRLYMPLIKKLKKTLTGGDEGFISPLEWKRFALLGSRGYVQFLRYKYFLKDTQKGGVSPELTYVVRSIDDLFSYFGDMVSEKPDQVLTKEELLEIFGALEDIFPQIHVSEKFLFEVMKIKRLFFGGSLDYWEQQDFEKARSKLDAFRSLTEEFLQFVEVYGLSWIQPSNPSEAALFFSAAKTKLVDFASRIGMIIETDYNLSNLYVFAEEFDKLFQHSKWQSKSTFKPLADRFLPTVIAIKNIVLMDQDAIVGRDQWPSVLRVSSMSYNIFLEYYYFLKKNNDWLTVDSQTKVSSLGNQGLKVLSTILENREGLLSKGVVNKNFFSISANTSGAIDKFEILNLLIQMRTASLISSQITDAGLDQILKSILNHFLMLPAKRINYGYFDVLDKDSVRILASNFNSWSEGQYAWLSAFQNALNGPNPSQPFMKESDWLEYLKAHNELSVQKEFLALLSSPLSFAKDEKNRLWISRAQKYFSRDSLNLQNIGRVLIRWVIQSYATEESRAKEFSGITKVEAQTLFDDVKQLFIDIEFLDPANVKFPMNRFREANLFVPRANGDEFVSFTEGYDLMWMILSGLEIDANLFKGLSALDSSCPIIKPGNSTSKLKWMISINCVMTYYKSALPKELDHLPGFIKFWKALTIKGTKDSFLDDVLKAAGAIPNEQGLVKVTDVALVPHIVQYIESVMQKYDINDSGLLNTYEALNAYPVFKNILFEVSGQDSDKRLKGLFTWLLKYSKPPETWTDKAKYLLWCEKDPENWDVNASRATLASILGFIAVATAGP